MRIGIIGAVIHVSDSFPICCWHSIVFFDSSQELYSERRFAREIHSTLFEFAHSTGPKNFVDAFCAFLCISDRVFFTFSFHERVIRFFRLIPERLIHFLRIRTTLAIH